jgi:hypothetical protein
MADLTITDLALRIGQTVAAATLIGALYWIKL